MVTRRKAPRRTSVAAAAEKVRSRDRAPQKQETNPTTLIPTGCTLLNLALSDTASGGWPLGKISTMPGASAAGKTILGLTALAAANLEERFDEYKFVFDDIEQRLDFDMEYLFGTLQDRIEEPPLGISDTIQDLQNNVLTLCKGDEPFLYILDSLDALSSDEELEKEMRKALAAAKSKEAAEKIAGSYGTEKAKILGKVLRMIKAELARTDSALLILQQMRQNLNAGPFGKKYKVSGGEAPFFYSHVRPILAKIKTHKSTTYNKKQLATGVRTRVDMEKNSVTGKLRQVEFDIFYDLGVDDTGSMVDWLVDEKWWSKTGQKIKAECVSEEPMTRSKLVRYIERHNLESVVQAECQEAWNKKEDSVRTTRKRRF